MFNKNEIGLLLLRIIVGLVFLANGVSKFQGGVGNTAAWFDSIGIPGFLAYVVSTIELVGGIALILGLGTRVFSALIGIIMLGAILTVKLPNGFLNGYVYDLVLLIIAIDLLLNGSKLYALDNLLTRRRDNHLDSATKSA